MHFMLSDGGKYRGNKKRQERGWGAGLSDPVARKAHPKDTAFFVEQTLP